MSSQSDKLAIFMTATDTGVGKTTITAALTLALQQRGQRVGVMKPVETGMDPRRQEHSDTERLRSLLSPPPLFASICLYAFPEPLAPLACAREAGTTIEVSRIVSCFHDMTRHYSLLFVEGAGGVLTPITPMHTMRDLMVTLNIPALVVGRTSLGSVNHLLLTLEALQSAGIKTCGVALNEPASQTCTSRARQQQASTVELIRELAMVPVFGPVGFQENLQTHWRQGVETLANHPEIQRLAEHLIGMLP
jgi:dethiobiotin synthetase